MLPAAPTCGDAELLAAAESEARLGRSVVLATVVAVEGSAFRRLGARALVREDGSVVGSVSGGCLEGDLARRARALGPERPTSRVVYDQSEGAPLGVATGCHGAVTVLLEWIAHPAEHPLLRALAAVHRGEAGALTCAVVTASGDAQRIGTRWVAAAGLEPRREGGSGGAPDGSRDDDVFVEVLRAPPLLAVAGAGPDATTLTRFARAVGFAVSPWPVAGGRPIAAAVVMFHHLERDLAALRALASLRLPYVGLVGARARGREVQRRLAAEGLLVEGLRAPAGLDLGGDGPEAMALSIVAELTAALHRRSASPLARGEGPIHGR